jgi:hypothetical protein
MNLAARSTPASILVALLAFAGCNRPATEQKVDASSLTSYQLWLDQASGSLSPEQLQRVKQAESDIKLDVMAHGTGSGSDAVFQEFAAQINGKTVHEMIVLGLQDRIKRITADRDEAQRLYDDNSKIRAKPGDEASANYISVRVNEDKERMTRDNQQLEEAQSELRQEEAPSAAH